MSGFRLGCFPSTGLALWVLTAAVCLCACDFQDGPTAGPTADPVVSCTPGESRCANAAVQQLCSQAGFFVNQPCPSPWSCVADRCQPTVCQPGLHWCSAAGVARVCSADGTFVADTDCGATGLRCADGQCLAEVCVPGTASCADQLARTCLVTGTGYSVQDCAAKGKVCQSGLCLPKDFGVASCKSTCGPWQTCVAGTCRAQPAVCPDSCPAGQHCDPTAGPPVCKAATCAAPKAALTGLRVTDMKLVGSYPGCLQTTMPFAFYDMKVPGWLGINQAKLSTALADGSLGYFIDLAQAASPTAQLTWLRVETPPGAACPPSGSACSLQVNPQDVHWFDATPVCTVGTPLAAQTGVSGQWLDAGAPLMLTLPLGGTASLPLVRTQLKLGPPQATGSAVLCGEVPLQAWLAAVSVQYGQLEQLAYSDSAYAGVSSSGACGPGPRFGLTCSQAADCGSGKCDTRTFGFVAELTVAPAQASGVAP